MRRIAEHPVIHHLGLVLTSTLVATGACTAGDAPVTDPSVPTVSQEIDRDRVLPLVEELRVDGSREDLVFNFVTDAALDDAGNMYVLDVGNSQIVVVDADGSLVRRIGGQGQGPGEFSRPRSLSILGDTIGVADSGNRVHFFLTDGTVLDTRSYLDLADGNDRWSISGLTGTPDGWLVRATAYFRTDASGSNANLPPLQRTRVFRLDEAREPEPTGFYFEHQPTGEMVGIFFVQPPFYSGPITLMDGLGRMHVFERGGYGIDVYDASGEILYRVNNEIERDPVTRRDLDEWREDRRCQPGQPECDESRNELALSMEIPEYKPIVGRVVAFPTGHLAVLRNGTDPDPDEMPILGEYDVFDPEGLFIGRFPVGLSPRWFDGETLVATQWDEMLVPSMVRYRVGER